MALSETEVKRIEKTVGQFVQKRRPPPEIRDQLDISFRISDQSFVIFEIRPRWDNPNEKIEGPIAKATFVRSTKKWKLFWKRADNKWHGYEPFSESRSLERILDVIDKDECGCFWG